MFRASTAAIKEHANEAPIKYPIIAHPARHFHTHEATGNLNKMAAKIEKVDMSLDDIIKQNRKNTRGGRGGRGRRGRGGGGPARGNRGRINKNRSTPYSRVSDEDFFEHIASLSTIFSRREALISRYLTNIISNHSLNSYQTDGSMTFLMAIVVSEEEEIAMLAVSQLAVSFTFPTWISACLIPIFR